MKRGTAESPVFAAGKNGPYNHCSLQKNAKVIKQGVSQISVHPQKKYDIILKIAKHTTVAGYVEGRGTSDTIYNPAAS